MTPEINDRIRSVGKFKLIFVHSIDLFGLLTPNSQNKLHIWRAYGMVSAQFAKAFSEGDVTVGTFHMSKQGREAAQSRMRVSLRQFEKGISTSMFLEKAVPMLFRERDGEKLSDTSSSIRLGRKCSLTSIFVSEHSKEISYDDCELRFFPDGVLSLRFQFSGEDLPIESYISLIIELRKLTRRAMLDKVKLVVRDLDGNAHPLNTLDLDFINPQEIDAGRISFQQFSSEHKIIIVESMKDETGNSIPVSELENQPGLFGVLRQTQRAIGYKTQILTELKDYNRGYKSDEIYLTFRGTTLIVLPKHWNPQDYLSIYLDDLTLLIEYYVSNITYLDTLAVSIDDIEILNEPLESIKITRELVNQIIILRKILLRTEENLDVDLLVNHYFTRGVLVQLIEQRGISNKLESIRRRIHNMDRILDLIVNSSFSQMGVGSSVRQVRLAIIALLATLLFSIAALTLSIIQNFRQPH